MSSRTSHPAKRPVRIVSCLIALAFAIALIAAASAHAADYKMLLCAGNNGSNGYGTSTNTISAQHPSGIFDFENHCGPAPDPAGNSAFLRIAEHEPSGSAGPGAYGAITYTAPPWVAILAGGGYTREPNAFNEGWRGQFWAEDFAGNGTEVLNQGQGLPNSGLDWASTSTFAPHLWPYGGFGSYRGFVFELTCVRPSGCDRSNYNAVDANTFVLILADTGPPSVGLNNNGGPIMEGRWVRGTQAATYQFTELGSGIRIERIRIDGAERWFIDHQATGECNVAADQTSGEFARAFQPCAIAPNPIGRSYSFDTASLADGEHTLQACAQDYSQYQGLNGTGGESCDQRTIRTDNSAPGAPSGLTVTSANPARYLDHFGAQFSLPPNQGSPITKVHYSVLNAAGEAVEPERTLSAANPTEVPQIEGPAKAGDYRLRVWLGDEVGFTGPAVEAPIPHDTTPPAAPQGVSVTAPTTPRSADGFDLRWHNIVDAGSPIDAAHYQVLDGSGKVVVPTQTAGGDNVQAIPTLEAPSAAGSDQLRLWLTDAEGNVGAPVTAPLSYDCMRSPTPGGQQLSADLGGQPAQIVQQGQGAMLAGALRGPDDAPVATAPVCVYSRVVTDRAPEFLGIALTDAGGGYRFPVPAGASRELSAIYRPGQRELRAQATLQTVVHPTLRARSTIVHNGEFAHLEGEIPGPHNDGVVVVVQVRQGGGWLAFRRYTTRGDGHFEAAYQFRRTTKPTSYEMRAQVREATGYPYLQGESDPLTLQVVPGAAKHKAHRRRCPAGRHLARRWGKLRCLPKPRHHSRHTGRRGGRR